MATQLEPVILLAFASPDETQPLRALPREGKQIRDALEPLVASGRLAEPLVLWNATVDGIVDELRKERFYGRVRVLHFGGHASDSALVLADDEGAPAIAHAEGLADYLGQQPGLELVVLNGCSTKAQIARLHHVGIPAVVATSRAVMDDVAADFAAQLYAELATKPLKAAFDAATAAVRIKEGESPRELALDTSDENEWDESWPWVLSCSAEQEAWRLLAEAPRGDEPLDPRPIARTPAQHVILLLGVGAEPTAFAERARALEDELHGAGVKNSCTVTTALEDDVGRAAARLVECQPTLVEITTRGGAGIDRRLGQADGHDQWPLDDLLPILHALRKRLACVVFDASGSDGIARALAGVVPACIGLRGALSERAAVEHSRWFHRIAVLTNDVPTAFQIGRAAAGRADPRAYEVLSMYADVPSMIDAVVRPSCFAPAVTPDDHRCYVSLLSRFASAAGCDELIASTTKLARTLLGAHPARASWPSLRACATESALEVLQGFPWARFDAAGAIAVWPPIATSVEIDSPAGGGGSILPSGSIVRLRAEPAIDVESASMLIITHTARGVRSSTVATRGLLLADTPWEVEVELDDEIGLEQLVMVLVPGHDEMGGVARRRDEPPHRHAQALAGQRRMLWNDEPRAWLVELVVEHTVRSTMDLVRGPVEQ